MIYQLPDDDFWFPDPLSIPEEEREEDGPFAVGGDLSVERLVEAYSQGVFPWTAFQYLETAAGAKREWWNQLHWYCPMSRFVIFPEEVHVSHSMRPLLYRDVRVTFDGCFDRVIEECSRLRIEHDGAWLGPQMVEAYKALHDSGYASSVEVWDTSGLEEELIGGLYGVEMKKAFFGESMFSLKPNASKIALIHLCRKMAEDGGKFIDCQFETPHLKSMGGRYISYEEYMERLWSDEKEQKA